MNNNFIGKGWAFPPAFNNRSGNVEMSEGITDIQESLQILLSTTLGERVMQPKYGCNLREYMFESLDSNRIGVIKQRVKDAILFYEPRIIAESCRNSDTEEHPYCLFPLPFHESCCFLDQAQRCTIYSTRPQVCRDFEAGSSQCQEARSRQGIEPLRASNNQDASLQ